MLRRHTWTMAALAAIVAFAAACSSNSTSPGSSTTASSTSVTSNSTQPQAHGAYEQCLAAHGVPAPSGRPQPGNGSPPEGPPPGPPPEGTSGATPPPPPGVDQSTWDNAVTACKSLAPSPPAGSR